MREGQLQILHKRRSRIIQAIGSLRDRDWSRAILFGANNCETAYCAHLVLAAILFSPFLLFGQVLAANPDLLTENYPMLLLAKHNFWHHSLGLWDPYMFGGISQGAEANTPLFLPENWVLFLIPTRFLFQVIAFFAFIKIFLIGVAAHRFYSAELLNRRWALFASISLQLSGTTIWFLASYVGLSVELFYLVLLALIWTEARRDAFANYLLWSTAATLMLMAGDVAHAAYGLLSAGILILYRVFSLRRASTIRHLTIFTASSITALLILSIRLFPILTAIHASQVISDCCVFDFKNASFLITQFFDTEILGVNFADSQLIFANISPLFDGWHLQAFSVGFFGLAAAFLALWALASEKSRAAGFWSIWVIFSLGTLLFLQPFDSIVTILLAPVRHRVGLHMMLVIGFPALAALGGMSLERIARRGRYSRLTLEFVISALIMIAMFIFVIFVRNIWPLSALASNSARFLAFGILLGSALLVACSRSHPAVLRMLGQVALGALFVAAVGIIAFWSDGNSTFVSHLKNIGAQLLIFSAIAWVSTSIVLRRSNPQDSSAALFSAALIAVCLCVLLYPWTFLLWEPIPQDKSLVLAGLGAVRFLVGVAIFCLTLRASLTKLLPAKGIYIVLLALLVAEQVPAGKIHMFISGNPFYAGTLYPPLERMTGTDGTALDLANYRVNFPITLLALPFEDEMFGPANEICASTNVAYGIPSYGGYTDAIPSRTLKLAENWLPPDEPKRRYCIFDNQTGARFLDLTATGYQYDSVKMTIARRPSALSRFMLFTDFSVVANDQEELERLKVPAFQPLKQIILDESPGFQNHSSAANGQKLDYDQSDSDHIKLSVRSDSPALVLFDDSFDRGWRATVNGRRQAIMRANYNFMAIPVPAGNSRIVLEYWPRAFQVGAICAGLGLAMLAFAFIVYLARVLRVARASAAPSYSWLREFTTLRTMLLSVIGVSLIQIISGGSGKFLEGQLSQPVQWTISYLNSEGQTVISHVQSPKDDLFNEGIAKGPIRIEMDFRRCQFFSRYRFWVGPYGVDTTNRQPREWTLFVRGDDGDWIRADNEQVKTAYKNDRWAEFPLNTGNSCIRHVRWDIAKVMSGNIFRLFRFELYNSALASALR